MSTSMGDLIDTIEHEIGTFYQAGAIRWIDENMSDAWTAALDRFDDALGKYSVTSDRSRVEAEARIYKAAVIEFLKIYKEQRAQKKTACFFEELKQRQVVGS